MSKNKNYSEYYKKPEEPKVDEPAQEVEEVTSEEIQEAEEPAAEIEETPVEEKPDPVKYGMVVKAAKVNMREQPSKESKVLAILPKGAKVKILTIDTDVAWEHIEFDGRKGYMMSQFVMRLPLVMGE